LATENLHYWQYFAAIERDLAATSQFVEFCSENMAVHSIEFAKILLTAGSEIDVLAKVLCREHDLAISPDNINGYRKAIVPKFPEFAFLEICMPRFGLSLRPWRTWHDGKNPTWWQDYNTVKHRRHENFQLASLGSAMNAVAGLFTLVCYICNKELRASTALPWPQILSLDASLNSRIRNDLRPGYILPDFRD
jgi:hypothetical protein